MASGELRSWRMISSQKSLDSVKSPHAPAHQTTCSQRRSRRRAGRGLALMLMALLAAVLPLSAQQLDILIIGSTHSYSDAGPAGLESGVVQEKAFNPTTIATRLQSILSQDTNITETVNVEFEDIYKTARMMVPIGGSGTPWDMQFRCFSLMQHFMWPDGKDTRMANLRGEGVHLGLHRALRRSLCDGQFPRRLCRGGEDDPGRDRQQRPSGATGAARASGRRTARASPPRQFNEIVASGWRLRRHHRVVPAGKAWDFLHIPGQQLQPSHAEGRISRRGRHLQQVLRPQREATSGYTYPSDGDNIADHVLAEVRSGRIDAPIQRHIHHGRTPSR